VPDRRDFLKGLALSVPAIATTPLAVLLEACGGSTQTGGGGIKRDAFAIKMESAIQPTQIQAKAIIDFAAEIKDKSNNVIQPQLFWEGQLGTDASVWNNLVSGAMQMMCTSPHSYLPQTLPDIGVVNLPFSLRSEAALNNFLTTSVGKDWLNYVRDKGGAVPISTQSLGFRLIWNSRGPINTIDDLKGLKLRAQVNGSDSLLIKSLGATPIPMDSIEIYSAVQQGVVQGGFHPIDFIQSLKFYEVAKYATIIPMQLAWVCINVNATFWGGLADDLKGVVQTAANHCRTSWNAGTNSAFSTVSKFLTDNGVKINTFPDSELTKLVAFTGPVWDDWITKSKSTPAGIAWARSLAKDAGIPLKV
jgi:TRAP-type C4-dicarboxylate transport system substrate-binding protein